MLWWLNFVTIRADERFFTGVNFAMSIHTAHHLKFLVTIRAYERFFAGVNSTMFIQVAALFEFLVTIKDMQTALHQYEFYDVFSCGYGG